LQLERVRVAQARGVRVEVWFQDEARVGQKNTLTRVWGPTGSRPAAPKDLGFASAYLFGAVCPSEGKAAALIMPICNTTAMNHHLSEISSQVAVPRFREGRLCPCRGDPRSCRLASQPRSRGAR
jgi:putative transposase